MSYNVGITMEIHGHMTYPSPPSPLESCPCPVPILIMSLQFLVPRGDLNPYGYPWVYIKKLKRNPKKRRKIHKNTFFKT